MKLPGITLYLIPRDEGMGLSIYLQLWGEDGIATEQTSLFASIPTVEYSAGLGSKNWVHKALEQVLQRISDDPNLIFYNDELVDGASLVEKDRKKSG